MQAVIQVQSLFIEADDLRLHPHLGAQLHLVQIIDVRLQREQRITALPAAVGVQANACLLYTSDAADE